MFSPSKQVNIDDETLTNDQKTQLCDLIDEFSNVFVGPDNQLGHTDILQHHIDVDPKHKPVRMRAYRMGPKQKEAFDDMTEQLIAQDVIENSLSPWAAPCFLVAKKCGKTFRVVVDYRRLNALTDLDAHPLLTTDEALDHIGTNNPAIFTTLDLQSGFYQISIDPESRAYTAFRTHKGLFQYKRMPMGLKNSPSTFQRLMEAVLRGCLGPHA
jgi:hypothetical protein